MKTGATPGGWMARKVRRKKTTDAVTAKLQPRAMKGVRRAPESSRRRSRAELPETDRSQTSQRVQRLELDLLREQARFWTELAVSERTLGGQPDSIPV